MALDTSGEKFRFWGRRNLEGVGPVNVESDGTFGGGFCGCSIAPPGRSGDVSSDFQCFLEHI
jgi:hypothetical protein